MKGTFAIGLVAAVCGLAALHFYRPELNPPDNLQPDLVKAIYAPASPLKVFLVDKIQTPGGTNYLVRGNLPLKSDGSYAYSELADTLKSKLGITLSEHKLVNFSIIDNVDDKSREALKNEFVAFGLSKDRFESKYSRQNWPPFEKGLDLATPVGTSVNGHRGSMIWFPVQGCSEEADCRAIQESQFGFPQAVDALAQNMKSNEPTIIYAHCSQGVDRIAALMAGYLLKHKGASVDDVLNPESSNGVQIPVRGLADAQAGKNSKSRWAPDYERLVRWYAATLG